ncbi:KOW domain-containing RNA-binding protein [Porcipelethomonas sp.]|uniref:KOW domain-containing RNA-binding protein n=1 Tax=Porcipelethomonas sp. TaxID=2981675 RepID=UPI003EF60085
MKIENGRVVKATAGRDSGGYFVIVGADENCVYIADGKRRRLTSPKKKNLKHLTFTSKIIELNDITDKKLRNVLGDYAAHTVTDMGR